MPHSHVPILLIGYRGTGKSSVARELAARLQFDSIDADEEVERRAGKTIAAIFADEGEGAFRDLEAAVVADLCQRQRSVIALGGGAILRDDNRAAICAAGPIIWLTASIDTIAARTASDAATASRRPNLTTTGGRAEIDALLAQRTPLYEACATVEIDTDGKTPSQIADEIVTKLNT